MNIYSYSYPHFNFFLNAFGFSNQTKQYLFNIDEIMNIFVKKHDIIVQDKDYVQKIDKNKNQII